MVGGLLSVISLLEQYSFSPIKIFMTQTELYYYYGLLVLICWVFLEKQFKWIRFLYCYILIGFFCLSYFENTPVKELFVNASGQGLIISVSANNEQIIIADKFEAINYLLGNYSIRNSIDCIDTVCTDGIVQNDFCRVGNGLIQYLDKRLLILNDELVNEGEVMRVDVLLMRSYRFDIDKIQRVFSPKKVLLDASLSNKQKQSLCNQWQELGLIPVDLKESVYIEEY